MDRATPMDQLYFVVHTHWDREWYQPFQRMRARLVAMADRMIPLVEDGAVPFFHFDGQTIVLEDYLQVRPHMASRISALIRSGKIQVGPWYVLADSFLVSGESLIRNLEVGMKIARRFGRPLMAGYLPDQFGHTAQLPQILAGFGFATAVLWRGVGADIAANRFVWEALDGTALPAVYLPFGYSNGANLPLDSAESFVARAQDIVARERAFADSDPILVMTGTDHAEPDPRLATRIREAREIAPLSCEIGTLERYLASAFESGTDSLAHHRGELRSPLRAHLLPGVTSARTWIKQRDFQNCYLLERLADPLAALAETLGGAAHHREFLDLAWRNELQNHPHDSICGCSVDQVHADMRYRFDQASIIGENVVREAAQDILARADGSDASLAVFNPSFARKAVVTGEIELDDPDAAYVARGPDGSAVPVSVEMVRAAHVTEITMRAAEFKAIVAALKNPAFMGRALLDYELGGMDRDAHQFEIVLTMARTAASGIDLERFRTRVKSEIPDDTSVHIRATIAARYAIAFVAEHMTQAGFTFYRIEHTAKSGIATTSHEAGSIANDFYRISSASDGLEIEDLQARRKLTLHFEDDGDRGDEYNFDPIPAAPTLCRPVQITARVKEDGAARKRLVVLLTYAIPGALTEARDARDPRTEALSIELTASLFSGIDRIDFAARVVNRSRDHRLRVALGTPITTRESVHDTSFGIVRRPLKTIEPDGTEDIYPTCPHRTFTAVESDEYSVTMISRGLYEAEVRPEAPGSTILLTLLRCVGWLSRSDLATRRGGAGPELETPDAQELGDHQFEFAVVATRSNLREGKVMQRAAAFTAPPRSFPAQRDFKTPPALLACDNPAIVFSTARPAPRTGAYRARVFSVSTEPERARFHFPTPSRVRMVNLGGMAVKRSGVRRNRDSSLAIEIRPFEIVTFEVAPRKLR